MSELRKYRKTLNLIRELADTNKLTPQEIKIIQEAIKILYKYSTQNEAKQNENSNIRKSKRR